jgi:putative component of membrane protein insertase Oxa1/YidC/SpoIIIJ protein YidD
MASSRDHITRAVALVSTLLLASACATPRPSLEGSGESFMSRADVLEPFSSSKKTPAIAPLKAVSPWGDPSREPRQVRESNIMELGYRFYSNHLTKVDGPRCEHRPTCSRYARDAMRKHGSVVGSWLTVDRLLRTNSSSSLRTLPVIKYYEGRPYFADPVDENDFFF